MSSHPTSPMRIHDFLREALPFEIACLPVTEPHTRRSTSRIEEALYPLSKRVSTSLAGTNLGALLSPGSLTFDPSIASLGTADIGAADSIETVRPAGQQTYLNSRQFSSDCAIHLLDVGVEFRGSTSKTSLCSSPVKINLSSRCSPLPEKPPATSDTSGAPSSYPRILPRREKEDIDHTNHPPASPSFSGEYCVDELSVPCNKGNSYKYGCELGCTDKVFQSARERCRHYGSKAHERSHFWYHCGGCGKQFQGERRDNYLRHLRSCVQRNGRSYFCGRCSERDINKDRHVNHVERCKGIAGRRPKSRRGQG
ncbi:hypothetical protein BDW69DRAFT_170868 [Aspergillus filifer]